MAKQWKEIALVLRDRQFDETEDLEIDIFDVEVNNLNEFFLTYNYCCCCCFSYMHSFSRAFFFCSLATPPFRFVSFLLLPF